NVISGNAAPPFSTRYGLNIDVGSSNNVVQGNFIGTDATGTRSLFNLRGGIRIGDSSFNNVIGGSTAGARNVISGNGGPGGRIESGQSVLSDMTTQNKVQGNYIGTDAGGTGNLFNQGEGVRIVDASGNLVGGRNTGEGNRIAFNQVGVRVQSGAGNGIL